MIKHLLVLISMGVYVASGIHSLHAGGGGESAQEEFTRIHDFFKDEGMLQSQPQDNKSLAFFFDTFSRFFTRMKTAEDPEHITKDMEKLRTLYHAYLAGYAKLIVFMVSDKDLEIGSSSTWRLPVQKLRDILTTLLSQFHRRLFVENKKAITPDDIKKDMATLIQQKAGRPSRPLALKIKVSQSSENEGRMYDMRDQSLAVDPYGLADDGTLVPGAFFENFRSALTALLALEHRYASYEKNKNDEEARALVDEYESFITTHRDPLLQSPAVGRLGKSVTAILAESKKINNDYYAVIIWALSALAKNRVASLKGQFEALQVKTNQRQEQQKKYEQATTFGADSFRAGVSEKYTVAKPGFSLLQKTAQTKPGLSHALDRYDIIMDRYLSAGTLSEGDLGQWGVASATLVTERTQLQKAAQSVFQSPTKKKEIQNQIATIDNLLKLSTDVRGAIARGGAVAEHEQIPDAVRLIAQGLDIVEGVVRSDPQFVFYLKGMLQGGAGAISNLVGHIRSLKNAGSILKLLSLWGQVEKNDILRQTIDVSQIVLKEHGDKMKKLYAAFAGQQTFIAAPYEVREWQSDLERRFTEIEQAPFVSSGALHTMRASLKNVSSLSADMSYKQAVDTIIKGQQQLLVAAWRQIKDLQGRTTQPSVGARESGVTKGQPVKAPAYAAPSRELSFEDF